VCWDWCSGGRTIAKQREETLARPGRAWWNQDGRKPVAQRIARSNAQSRCVSNASSDSGSFSITGPTLEIELRGTEREARLVNRDVLADRCPAIYTKMAAERSRHQRKFPNQPIREFGEGAVSPWANFSPGLSTAKTRRNLRIARCFASPERPGRVSAATAFRRFAAGGSPSIFNTHGGALRFSRKNAAMLQCRPTGIGSFRGAAQCTVLFPGP
jgi:hypothetical protein